MPWPRVRLSRTAKIVAKVANWRFALYLIYLVSSLGCQYQLLGGMSRRSSRVPLPLRLLDEFKTRWFLKIDCKDFIRDVGIYELCSHRHEIMHL